MRKGKKRRSKERYQLPLMPLEVVLGEARRFVERFGFPAISETETDSADDNWVRLTWKTKRDYTFDIVFETQPDGATECRWECTFGKSTEIFVKGTFISALALPKRFVETLTFIGLRRAPQDT